MQALSPNQRGRPRQPVAPLSSSELATCLARLDGHWPRLRLQHNLVQPSLLTYLTDVCAQGPWALGLSAAHHRVPFVVQGLGMRWAGVGFKLPAVRRTVQLLQALRPNGTIVFADGSDAAVANAVPRRRPTDQHTIILSAECGSFPICYKQRYMQHKAYQACRNRSRTCYPNSGVYMGQPEALLNVLPALQSLAANGDGVEHMEDQSAANRLYYSQASASVEVDGDSQLFLSLYRCKGPSLRKFDRFTLCHDGHHDPLRYVHRHRGGRALSYNYSGKSTRPFIVHANGLHQRLSWAYFGSGAPQERAPRNWTELYLPSRAAVEASRSHPVLLVDSAAHGLCHLSTLGELTASRNCGL